MNLKQTLPVRKKMRLQGYDYTYDNYYFITVCTKNKKKIFGEIQNGQMVYTNLGKIIDDIITTIPTVHDEVLIDKYVVMPNHVHLIISLENREREIGIPAIMRGFKSYTDRKYKENSNEDLWQTSYYDRIIRNDKEYLKIWKYIDENILKWELDCYY